MRSMTLKMEKDSHPVLIKEIQRNAITRQILHVDLHRVSLKQKVEASVPLHVKGEAPGVKLGGGVLEHVVREVRVRCLPTNIPAAIDVDVSALQVNQSLKAKDLHLPEGVELLQDLEGVIINIVSPTILEEPTVAAAPAGCRRRRRNRKSSRKAKSKRVKKARPRPATKKPLLQRATRRRLHPRQARNPEAKKPEGK